jgi:hypothetical protein
MSQLKVDTITNEAGTGSPSLPNGLTVGGVNYPTTGPLSNRNKIINGAMVIDQRNAGAAVTIVNDDRFAVDRFFVRGDASGVSGTIQRSTVAPAGFNSSYFINIVTGGTIASSDRGFLGQSIEGFNVADFNFGSSNATAVTFSFWVRTSLTGTFSGALQNDAQTRSYVFTFVVNSADTWEYKTITIAGDTAGTWVTDNGNGLRVNIDIGNGSDTRTATTGAWQTGNFRGSTGSLSLLNVSGATFYITGVQLEAGTVATPFEHRSFGQELALCQRYFCKTYQQDTVPGATGTTGVGALFTPNPVTNSYPILGTWNFPSTMRATPTIVLYNPSTGAVGGFLGDSTNFSSASVGSAGQRGASFFGSNVSVGTSVFMSVQATASAEL